MSRWKNWLFKAKPIQSNFALESKQIKLDEVVVKAKGRYKNKDNPAVALIQKVVDNREQIEKKVLITISTISTRRCSWTSTISRKSS